MSAGVLCITLTNDTNANDRGCGWILH